MVMNKAGASAWCDNYGLGGELCPDKVWPASVCVSGVNYKWTTASADTILAVSGNVLLLCLA